MCYEWKRILRLKRPMLPAYVPPRWRFSLLRCVSWLENNLISGYQKNGCPNRKYVFVPRPVASLEEWACHLHTQTSGWQDLCSRLSHSKCWSSRAPPLPVALHEEHLLHWGILCYYLGKMYVIPLALWYNYWCAGTSLQCVWDWRIHTWTSSEAIDFVKSLYITSMLNWSYRGLTCTFSYSFSCMKILVFGFIFDCSWAWRY